MNDLNGVVLKIAERWLASWRVKKGFFASEEALVIEFAKFVDKLIKGKEDEKSLG